MNNFQSLVLKYDKPVPRYTSYPTVPHWEMASVPSEMWVNNLNDHLKDDPRVSIYIHLPYCESLCTYCGCNKRITKNHKVEVPYLDAVIAEWKLYLDKFEVTPIIEELHLGGGTPTFFSAQNLHYLIKEILSNAILPDNPKYSFEAHPSSTTHEHLDTLFQLGFKRLSLGVQDVSPMILKAINRQQTTEQITDITNYARAIGYDSVNFDLIYGLPFQTLEHLEATMEYTGDIKPDRIAFYSYAHVPWKSKGQRAFSDDDYAKGYDKFKLKARGADILKEMGYQEIAMDHFALETDELTHAFVNGVLHRNFMGYTTCSHPVMVGLGTSSISETPDMYVQNEKVVEAYMEEVNNGRWALIRGHHLTPEEMKVKVQILHLMCQHGVHLSKKDMDQLLASHGPRLQEMKTEGLVELLPEEIRITSKGVNFVRNICVLFDPKIKETKTQQFSMAI